MMIQKILQSIIAIISQTEKVNMERQTLKVSILKHINIQTNDPHKTHKVSKVKTLNKICD